MGIPVFILGESGVGKSTSLRNFNENEVVIFGVAGKPLPFKKKLNYIPHATYPIIGKELRKQEKKIYVIDDSQYLMAFDLFEKAKEVGYTKFTDIAVRFKSMLDFIIKRLNDDIIVYLLHHIEVLDGGKIKAKTVGKMLDNQLTLEGLFSIVLYATTFNGEYIFETQTDGFTTAKSPIGMFKNKIPNDLKYVDTVIRDYWNLNK